ncbi:MAG: Hpt domain-containing protein [Candidatus Avelusimicrobium sp.]|uniref:Hpt domain-containing protein n=1 Tax=Candidatus Avelusimicrobium sp. TaxID=3048833 RepID=UPI003EFEF878
MTTQECYAALGGNYEEVLGRFRTEERILKFMGLFLKDDSFANLTKALEQNNLEEAFRAAHTLKGISSNLSFTRLYRSSHGLTELLRAKTPSPEISALFAEVNKDYEITAGAIRSALQPR